jgi:hypothetical protein
MESFLNAHFLKQESYLEGKQTCWEEPLMNKMGYEIELSAEVRTSFQHLDRMIWPQRCAQHIEPTSCEFLESDELYRSAKLYNISNALATHLKMQRIALKQHDWLEYPRNHQSTGESPRYRRWILDMIIETS